MLQLEQLASLGGVLGLPLQLPHLVPLPVPRLPLQAAIPSPLRLHTQQVVALNAQTQEKRLIIENTESGANAVELDKVTLPLIKLYGWVNTK